MGRVADMAGLAAVNLLGDSIAAMLAARRNLLAADGKLGPIPAALAIDQVPLSKLATATDPGSGLTITCTRIALSEHAKVRPQTRDAASGAELALEVTYLLTAWGGGADSDEQSILTWAMLELTARPVLDRSVLLGGPNVWAPEEVVQIVPETLSDDALFRLWGALQHKLRMSTTLRARVLRIGYGPGDSWPNVVATRFGFANADDPLVEGVQ